MSSTHSGAGPDGRYAEDVIEIPPRAWLAILRRTLRSFTTDNLSLVAGGATFFLLLAIFPALAAFVALYGLLFDVATVEGHVAAMAGVLPAAAIDLVGAELNRLASQPSGALGVGFVVGLLIALWSANAGVKALFAALNQVYGEVEERGFVRLTLTSLAFTLAAIIGAALLLAAVVVVPIVLGRLGLSDATHWMLSLLRWPVLLLLVMVGIAILFRYGGSRRPPRWRWIVWGAAVTAVLWVAASAAFSYYLSNFADYNATYGSLGAVVGFMMWLYVSLMILFAGAELNAEVERQLVTDTTVGPAKPMGSRGAMVADTLPEDLEEPTPR
ncbi:YihY/virulence factor BrkB family protein [Acuticoccus sp.]|uniref:YihY/virulence factor BrkB family protein n=1 Tax=Acuticoccus sp. TaxID=1904378 RepID=UPI003B5194C8